MFVIMLLVIGMFLEVEAMQIYNPGENFESQFPTVSIIWGSWEVLIMSAILLLWTFHDRVNLHYRNDPKFSDR